MKSLKIRAETPTTLEAALSTTTTEEKQEGLEALATEETTMLIKVI